MKKYIYIYMYMNAIIVAIHKYIYSIFKVKYLFINLFNI